MKKPEPDSLLSIEPFSITGGAKPMEPAAPAPSQKPEANPIVEMSNGDKQTDDKLNISEELATNSPQKAVHGDGNKDGNAEDSLVVTGPATEAVATEPPVFSTGVKNVGSENEQNVRTPEQIGQNDPIWGSTFWQRQAEECLNYDGKKDLEAVRKLAEKLKETRNEAVPSWLEARKVGQNEDVWIIGDVHGDLLALRAILHFVRATSQKWGRKPQWCFLGDLFDDGQYGHAVLFEVLQIVHEEEAWLVVGNHDLSLGWDEARQQFTADVSPREFADWLNRAETAQEWRELGKAACRWFATAARAVLLADGTLIAHGGCVHSDRLEELDKEGGHLSPEVLEDLVWLRASDSSRRKIPNRTSRGCQFGIEDLRDFLGRLGQKTGRTVHRVIRGHDHVVERWAAPPRHEGRLLTINAMSWRQREIIGPFARQPVVACHRADEFPKLFQLAIPEEIIQRLYGENGQSECGTSGK